MTFTWLEHLEMRLFAAALFFYGMALTVHAHYLLFLGVSAGYALLAIPIRVVLAVVVITDSLTGGKILGTQP